MGERSRVVSLSPSPRPRLGESAAPLDRAKGGCSRLYRRQILQENMRLKALAEISKMQSFAQLYNLNFLSKICQNFAKFGKISKIFFLPKFDKKMRLQSCAKECIVQISARAFKRIFSCKIWPRYSRERALSNLPDRAIQQCQRRGGGPRAGARGPREGPCLF